MAGCILSNRDGCKGLGGSAVGYWGRAIYKRVAAEQEFARQRALLTDQLALGLRINLWVGVTEGNQCSCYKESHKSAERKCGSCHGIVNGYVPGYLKFGFNTLWMTAVDDDVTLTGVEVTTMFHSSKVQLTSSAITGTIESGDKAFTRDAIGSVWEYEELDFVRIEESSTSTVEYSLDSGVTWSAMADLITANPSSGTIRFKATLTRTSTSILSPLFEVVRARYERIDKAGERGDGSFTSGPWINVLNSKPKKGYRKSEYGDLPAMDGGMSFWTTGLSTYDPDIELGSVGELLSGPNVAIQFLDGVLADDKKYVITNWQHSDPAAYIVTTQTFTARVADEVGPYSYIW